VSELVVRGADGVQLAVLAAGDADHDTVVFVHGYPDTKELWRPVLDLLAPRYHVVAYDVRGAGASSRPRGFAAYGVDRLADDLEAVLAAVSPGRPVHLVGHDWGGIAGWELVADPRLKGRIASFTSIAGPALRQIVEGLGELARSGRLLRVLARVRYSWYAFALCVPGVPTLAWRGFLRPGVWSRYLRYVERLPAHAAEPAPSLVSDGLRGANLYRRNVLWRTRTPGGSALVDVPVQLIVPTRDRWIPSGYYDGLEHRAAQLRRRVIAGSHWSPRANPELIADWVSAFVEEVQRGDAGSSRPWIRGGGLDQLAGRLALVTGAGSGIGRATALALGGQGARVLLVDWDGDAARATAALLERAHIFVCDVSDAAEMQQLANKVLGEHGVPDVVVNNAGIAVSGPFLSTGFDDWRRVIDVNVMGVVHGCRLFAEAMIERGQGGQIVNTASAAAFTPVKELPAYAASKAAVLMLSECLRSELLVHGIGVTAVCPGIVATNIPRAATYVGLPSDQEAAVRERLARLYERRNFTAKQVAAEILEAIATDRPVAVITPEAKLMRALSRFAPGTLRRLAAIDVLPG